MAASVVCADSVKGIDLYFVVRNLRIILPIHSLMRKYQHPAEC